MTTIASGILTERLIVEAEERDKYCINNHCIVILSRWVYSRKGYKSGSKYYFIDVINNNKHLPIDQSDVTDWNIAIQQGQATVEIPPDKVRTIMSVKSFQPSERTSSKSIQGTTGISHVIYQVQQA